MRKGKKKISGDPESAFCVYTKPSIRHWCTFLNQSSQNLSSLHAVISNMKEMATDLGENQGHSLQNKKCGLTLWG